MADDQRLRLDIALQPSDSTIRGTIDDGSGNVIDFIGWLELMSALDPACAEAVEGRRRVAGATPTG